MPGIKKTEINTKKSKDTKSIRSKAAENKAAITKVEAELKTAKSTRVTRAASSKLTADVYDLTGKVTESLDLPKEIFGIKENPKLIAQAVRVYLANQRIGSASTKTRGEVQGSTKKIYRQKGTGRARHGGIRAPIFVHGGIAHGPKPKDFSLQLPQKMRRAALLSILSVKAKNGDIKIVNDIGNSELKTKQMAAMFAGIYPKNKKIRKILFVLDTKNDPVIRAVRNIEGVTYEFAKKLHTYEVLTSNSILFMKSSIENMVKMYQKKETQK